MAPRGPFKMSFSVFIFITLLSSIEVQFRARRFVEGASGMDEKLLLERVFAFTNADVRPVNNSSEAVNVTLDITFHGVIDMDEKFQILTTDIWLRQEWTNQLVKWNPADFGGLEQVTIDSSQIWQPDIVLYNNVFEEFDGRMDNIKTRVRVHNDGHCYWAAPFVFKTSCRFDVRDFPYDKQRCKLKFGSWQFHSKQLDLFRKQENAPVAKDRVDNGEWKVTGIKIDKNVIKYDCCPNDLYPDITFVINLQRRSLFYTYHLVIPNFIITLLAFFSFYIPVECGERLSFVITVLLSMTVFLLLVAESIPPTSEAVPVIGLFFTSSIIEVALALIATGISLKVYYSYLYGKGLSPGLRKFLFYRVAPLLRLDTDHQNNPCTSKWRVGNPLEFVKELTRKFRRERDLSIYNVNAENKGRDDGETPTSLQLNELNLLSLSTCSESTQGTMPERDNRNRNHHVSAELEMIASAVKDHREFEKRAAECRIAAAIVDRAFMVMFIFVFFASSVIILLLPSMRKL
ncbi:PREDICTED: neuronal acetylcholine receptor subunit alpha-10-like isoform X3 [Acropora digitifera]|uniref:neuronal acetylcholine receptor subunit alpha-10-like isoform X3 n=1 Tax=Acropora digitifera TaxID=70779 RepID=UPI00077A889C|nr:PREDICTED: neuronal acetylcholine receptor subunit alpha-10-like isoform X3 [Acropora digitifera]